MGRQKIESNVRFENIINISNRNIMCFLNIYKQNSHKFYPSHLSRCFTSDADLK